MKEGKDSVKKGKDLIGSRPWIGSGWDIEKPATSRPKKKEG